MPRKSNGLKATRSSRFSGGLSLNPWPEMELRNSPAVVLPCSHQSLCKVGGGSVGGEFGWGLEGVLVVGGFRRQVLKHIALK